MKKILAILITFLCLHTKAQTNIYHPFPDSSAVWNETYWYQVGPPYSYVNNPNIIFISGDTIISGFHYKKLLSNGYSQDASTCCYYSNAYQGAIRQDLIHKKVYFCKVSTATDTLLYDFNLSVGDTLPTSYINYPNSNYVSSVDSILIGTSYRKQYHVSTLGNSWNPGSNYDSLIEGIGSTFGLLYHIAPPFESGSTLYCYSENNLTLYPDSNSYCDLMLNIKGVIVNQNLKIYPNPSNGSFQLEISNGKATEIKIYDISGKLVLSQSINGSTTINASTLNEGIYTLSVSNKEDTANKKLIIIK